MPDLLYAAVLEKSTGEQFDETFDFEGIIPEGTTVTYRTITATRDDGTDVTSTMVIASEISSDTVVVTLNTLALERSYLIKVSVKASDLTPAVMTKLLNITSPGLFK